MQCARNTLALVGMVGGWRDCEMARGEPDLCYPRDQKFSGDGWVGVGCRLRCGCECGCGCGCGYGRCVLWTPTDGRI